MIRERDAGVCCGCGGDRFGGCGRGVDESFVGEGSIFRARARGRFEFGGRCCDKSCWSSCVFASFYGPSEVFLAGMEANRSADEPEWPRGRLDNGYDRGRWIFGRGSNQVYSQWESISGSSNWSLDKILKTFDKLENYEGLTSGTRGTSGPVHVLQTPTVAPLTTNVLLPALLSGLPGIPIRTASTCGPSGSSIAPAPRGSAARPHFWGPTS